MRSLGKPQQYCLPCTARVVCDSPSPGIEPAPIFCPPQRLTWKQSCTRIGVPAVSTTRIAVARVYCIAADAPLHITQGMSNFNDAARSPHHDTYGSVGCECNSFSICATTTGPPRARRGRNWEPPFQQRTPHFHFPHMIVAPCARKILICFSHSGKPPPFHLRIRMGRHGRSQRALLLPPAQRAAQICLVPRVKSRPAAPFMKVPEHVDLNAIQPIGLRLG